MIAIELPLDELTLFLIGNGNVDATQSQEMYEAAINHGARPLNEQALKPDLTFRKRRRRHRGEVTGAQEIAELRLQGDGGSYSPECRATGHFFHG